MVDDMTNERFALIVEDDPWQAEIFSRALQQAGYETEIIGDGRSALARLEEIVPFLVVLDLQLPYVSGEVVLRHIRADERLVKVWVMLATANPQMAILLEGDSDFVLHKPVSFVQLSLLAARLQERE
jgi:CheY-like chemotaxis protein